MTFSALKQAVGMEGRIGRRWNEEVIGSRSPDNLFVLTQETQTKNVVYTEAIANSDRVL